jgi:predicted RNA binding protein YcfA (HicA-like mRNA interferase family)
MPITNSAPVASPKPQARAAKPGKQFTADELIKLAKAKAKAGGMAKPQGLPLLLLIFLFRIILASAARSISGKTLIRTLVKQGANVVRQNGSHATIRMNGRQTVIPNHNKDLPIGTLKKIRKDLGIPQ